MKQLKKTMQMLYLLPALLALAACQPDAEIEPDRGTLQISSLEVQMTPMLPTSPVGTRGAAETRWDSQYFAGKPKTGFVAGDVVHIKVAPTSADAGADNYQCYTATYDGTTTWKLNRSMVLPQDASKTYLIDAFYDGYDDEYTSGYNFDKALTTATDGTTNTSSGLTTYIDLLTAGGENSGGGWNSSGGITLSPDGKLTLKMRHQHALVRIASINNQMGSEIASIHANLVDDYGASAATVPLLLSSPAPGGAASSLAAEAMAEGYYYLKSFTVTLERAKKLTLTVPDRETPEGGTTGGKGTSLRFGRSYTFRLSLTPGSLSATLADDASPDAPVWEDKEDPQVPQGYVGIYDREGLEEIKVGDENAKYILMADIDLTPTTGANGNRVGLWKPIGTDSSPFMGIFNGNGHIIKRMTIDGGSTGNQGLFGAIDDNAILYNIHLRDVDVKGGSNIGALVGGAYIGTTISGCSSTGKVAGTLSVGGLVGYNQGHITRCWSTAAVSGGGDIGGLVGIHGVNRLTINEGTIVASYTQSSSVSISLGFYAGGLVGRLSGGRLLGCYAAQTAVSGNFFKGALIGMNEGVTVISCYATNAAASSDNSLVGSNDKGSYYYCISPLADASNEVDGITTSDNYAPLVPTNINSGTDVRTVVPVSGEKAGAIRAESRTWGIKGIWGELGSYYVILPPTIQWGYNGDEPIP